MNKKALAVNEEKRDKCFVIMPISDQEGYPVGHFTKVFEQIIEPAISEAGYEPYRVDSNLLSQSIILEIFNAIQDYPMAVCDLSSRNPNVLYELGLRQAYDKPVVLIKDEKTPRIFDVSGINTIEYNSMRLYENVVEAKENLKSSIIATRKKGASAQSIVKLINTAKAVNEEKTVSNDDIVMFQLRSIMSRLDSIETFSRKNDIKTRDDIYHDLERNRLFKNMTFKDAKLISNSIERISKQIKDAKETKNFECIQGIHKEIRNLDNFIIDSGYLGLLSDLPISELKNAFKELIDYRERESIELIED